MDKKAATYPLHFGKGRFRFDPVQTVPAYQAQVNGEARCIHQVDRNDPPGAGIFGEDR